MKVLITGNKGLVGSCLSSYLRKRGYEVFELDCDIRDKDRIFSSFDDHFKWDWIIHAAAKTDVDECQKDPQTCFDINVNGTNNIQELAKHHNTFLIYISTVSVFDGLVGNYTEKDAPTPMANISSIRTSFWQASRRVQNRIIKKQPWEPKTLGWERILW